MQYLATIVIPVFNAINYLSELLNDLEVTKEVEIVFSDDGSTDGSVEFLEEQARTHGNIKLLHNKRSGVSAARNAGVSVAKGKYVTFIDADDLVDIEKFMYLIHRLEHSEDDIVFANVAENTEIVADRDIKELLIGNILNVTNNEKFFSKRIISGPFNKFFKTTMLINNDVKFPVDVNLGEDLIFVLNAVTVSATFDFTPIQFYKYRIRQGSLSRSSYLNIPENAKNYLAHVEKLVDESTMRAVAGHTLVNDILRILRQPDVAKRYFDYKKMQEITQKYNLSSEGLTAKKRLALHVFRIPFVRFLLPVIHLTSLDLFKPKRQSEFFVDI